MIGVSGHDSALLRLYWAGDNLGESDEFCYDHAPGAGSISCSYNCMINIKILKYILSMCESYS